MAEIVMRRRFQLTEVGNNHNKFWEILRMEDGRVLSRWGRVGDNGQEKDYGHMGDYWIDSKIAEKQAKGYREVELARPQVVTAGLSPVDAKVEEITRFIFQEANESIAHTTAAPVDQLSLSQIEEGRSILRKLDALTISRSDHRFAYALQGYWNTIPTALPRNLRDSAVIAKLASEFSTSAEFDRLDQLEAAVKSLVVTGSGGSQYSALGAELTWLDPSDPRHQQITRQYNATRSRSNGLTIGEIFLVHIPHERKRYEESTRGKHNINPCLFHGTKTEYVRHILPNGLRLPQGLSYKPMFGYGIYFGAEAGKSETYLGSPRKARWNPIKTGAPYLMLVCEVALGTIKQERDAVYGLRQPPAGYDSMMGVKGKTLWFGGPSTLEYDEHVVYDPAQITIRALLTLR